MKKSNYITPQGLKRLLDEQEYLLKVERPKVTETVAWAASLGDRSENADYQYGKKRLREIDRRLRFLAKRIDQSVEVDPEKTESTKIQFGATVTLIDESDKERIFSIVGIDEMKTEEGLISWVSPIAKSLLGKEEGDEVVVFAPKGEIYYEVSKVEYKRIDMEEWSED